MFSCEFCENSKNTFFYRTPLVAASCTCVKVHKTICNPAAKVHKTISNPAAKVHKTISNPAAKGKRVVFYQIKNFSRKSKV